jgi:DNA-binding NarL/FixJ family response regulator
MAEGPAPLIVGDQAEVEAESRRLRAAGWQVRAGWELPERPWDLTGMGMVCTGEVADADGAAAAVLAAARGTGLLACLTAPPEVADRFLADLRRLGPIARPGAPERRPASPLTAEQRELLAQLAEGRSLAQAARLLHLSQRTAERRLAAARKALGARTTAEALLALGREAAG